MDRNRHLAECKGTTFSAALLNHESLDLEYIKWLKAFWVNRNIKRRQAVSNYACKKLRKAYSLSREIQKMSLDLHQKENSIVMFLIDYILDTMLVVRKSLIQI